MKHLLLFLALVPLACPAADFFKAEEGGPDDEPDHLVPLDQFSEDYDKRVAQHLFVTKGDFGRCLAKPSFEPESCFSVDERIPDEVLKEHREEWFVPDSKKKYFITVTKPSESLWYSMAENNEEKKTRKVEVKRAEREISRDLAVAIQRVWGRMLHQTRYPAKAWGGMDGITLQFSVWVWGLGQLEGDTWSPQKGLPAEMAGLSRDVFTFMEDKEAEEKPLIEKLKAFEAKIPKVPGKTLPKVYR